MAAQAPVLLVEDDADIREATAIILKLRGFPVVEARHGLEALCLLEGGLRPCVILLDLMMPVLDGTSLLDELEARGGLPAPVVVVTATHRPNEPRAAALLRKPWSLEQLDGVLQEALSGSRGRRTA